MDCFAYYVSHDTEANAERLADIPRIRECGLDGVCVALSPLDEPFVAACKEAGLRICASGNGLTAEQIAAWTKVYGNIESIVAQDDAHAYLGNLSALSAKVEGVRKKGAPLRDVISIGRIARGEESNSIRLGESLCNISSDIALQLYPYKFNAPIPFVYQWVKAIRAKHTLGRVIASPQLFANPDPYAPRVTAFFRSDSRLKFASFPTTEHIRQWTWLSIIAGADAIYYYSLRDAGGLNHQQPPKESYEYAHHYFLSLADSRASLADVIRQVKSVETYLSSKAEVTESENQIVALYPGEGGKRLCVKVNTSMDVPKTTVTLVERKVAQAEFEVSVEV